jgi:peptide deformylase
VAVRPIRIIGDPVLHTPTRSVEVFDEELKALVADMFDTMAAAEGVGLAANQIGDERRVFVYDCPTETLRTRVRGVVVNPGAGDLRAAGVDARPGRRRGGLPVRPGRELPDRAGGRAKVTGVDVDGAPVEVEGHGFLARCLQHEVDHLDGTIYVDRLVGRHRRAALKALKHNGWGRPGLAWDPATQQAEDV